MDSTSGESAAVCISAVWAAVSAAGARKNVRQVLTTGQRRVAGRAARAGPLRRGIDLHDNAFSFLPVHQRLPAACGNFIARSRRRPATGRKAGGGRRIAGLHAVRKTGAGAESGGSPAARREPCGPGDRGSSSRRNSGAGRKASSGWLEADLRAFTARYCLVRTMKTIALCSTSR